LLTKSTELINELFDNYVSNYLTSYGSPYLTQAKLINQRRKPAPENRVDFSIYGADFWGVCHGYYLSERAHRIVGKLRPEVACD